MKVLRRSSDRGKWTSSCWGLNPSGPMLGLKIGGLTHFKNQRDIFLARLSWYYVRGVPQLCTKDFHVYMYTCVCIWLTWLADPTSSSSAGLRCRIKSKEWGKVRAVREGEKVPGGVRVPKGSRAIINLTWGTTPSMFWEHLRRSMLMRFPTLKPSKHPKGPRVQRARNLLILGEWILRWLRLGCKHKPSWDTGKTLQNITKPTSILSIAWGLR